MSDPIDFSEAFDKKHGPNQEHVTVDGMGVKWFEFACHYVDDDGKRYGFTIWAKSHEDAEARMKMIAARGAVDGQLYETIPG